MSICYDETREERAESLDMWDEVVAELWVDWGDVAPHDADARARWLAEAVGWIRAMPHPIAACALWQLAERVHCTLWTGYTVEQAYLWLRQAVRGF